MNQPSSAAPNDIHDIAMRLRRDVFDSIKQRLVGKDEVVEVLGVAVVAGENAFLLGPPGTGKSAIVQEFAARLAGRTFDYLLTRFTEPSELFGPFDLRKLRDGELATNIEGMLPEADFVFLDELLNANSAILNSLLLALNERVFRRGRERFPLPMLLAVGASNRLPEDDALAALFDRFLLRVRCDNVPSERLSEVLDAGWRREQSMEPTATMSVTDIKRLQHAVTKVDLAPVTNAYCELIRRLRNAGMEISDRRAVRLQRVIAASAICCGRSVVDVSDLWIVRYIWDTPPQQEVLTAHLDSVLQEFATTASSGEDAISHPMADQGTGPDPERLMTLLDEIAAAPDRATAADALSLLAARIQWVQADEARAHLQQRIDELRPRILQSVARQG